ncbi:MAG: UDP-2,3-diacylglucosamine diphosphatase [Bacteroidia bacterium]
MNHTKEEKKKRKVDLVVISDVHLGTYGCHAKELLQYLKSIKPKTIVLNGDIIDMWQFSKRYFPSSHLKVLKHIISLTAKKVKVFYVTGNHDEMLRKFVGFKLGSLQIVNKLVLNLDGKRTWIFHGDVFDVTMKHSKWLTKLGAHGYDLLILINALCNWVLLKLGREKISLSKNIKNSVKSAVKFINNFEQTCADIAASNHYQNVICGHIHHPEIKDIQTAHGTVTYLNSGDWVENFTALEYHNGDWKIFKYNAEDFEQEASDADVQSEMNNKELFNALVLEFGMME